MKKEITSSLNNQTREPTARQQPLDGAGVKPLDRREKCRGRGPAGPGKGAAAGGAGTSRVLSPPLLLPVARSCDLGPRGEGARSGAHGPAGPRQEVHGSRAGGLLSDGGGGWARAGWRAAGRGSECAGRRPRRSVASRARREPERRRRRRRRPRGGGAGEGRGRRSERRAPRGKTAQGGAGAPRGVSRAPLPALERGDGARFSPPLPPPARPGSRPSAALDACHRSETAGGWLGQLAWTRDAPLGV